MFAILAESIEKIDVAVFLKNKYYFIPLLLALFVYGYLLVDKIH